MTVKEKVGTIRMLKRIDSTNSNFVIANGAWKTAPEVNYTKYQIKETDHRVKTATFSSPDYIDLTTGQYIILISSIYHENFAGIILDVEYDPDNGVYNYQCQDWSRFYMQGYVGNLGGKWNIYHELVYMLTHGTIDYYFKGKIPATYPYSVRKSFGDLLSGLKPIDYYDQSKYEGNRWKGNYFKTKPKMIIRNKTNIETIRDLVFGSLGYYDVWFNQRAILQIEPISKTDWEKTGLHLTTEAAMKQKYKFSTTNTISTVRVNGSGKDMGTSYSSSTLIGLDLSMFFGNISTSISDPTNKNTTSAASTTSNSTKTNTTTTTKTTTNKTTNSKTSNVNKDNPYGTKRKEVWITIDNIFGKSADKKIMNDFAREVQKAGWTTHVGNVGPSYHYAHAPGYSWAGKVWNAVWFVIYGGACAGTLYEAATAKWYRQPLVDRGSRTVVGFIRPPCGDIRKGGKYYSYLQRAHDDNFSPSSFRGLDHPGDFLTKKAIPWMYAKDGKSLAQSFLQGGDNPEACNKNWKFY